MDYQQFLVSCPTPNLDLHLMASATNGMLVSPFSPPMLLIYLYTAVPSMPCCGPDLTPSPLHFLSPLTTKRSRHIIEIPLPQIQHPLINPDRISLTPCVPNNHQPFHLSLKHPKTLRSSEKTELTYTKNKQTHSRDSHSTPYR